MLIREPIYQQLHGELRRLLAGGEFKPGGRFLTEREVAARFSVSRVTANKALATLVSEGSLEFRKGLGTFVRGGFLDTDLRALVSFTGRATQAGLRPSTRVLSFQTLEAIAFPPRLVGLLQETQSIHALERLRSADERPVILERRWVSASRCPSLSREAAAGSLYAFWTGSCNLRLGSADQVIRAVALDPAQARLLDTDPGSPALQVDCLGRLEDGAPLWWERTLYRADAYHFRNVVGPVPSGRPAAGTLAPAEDPLENAT
jgi:GntR family transcriptional regulator